VTQDLVSVAIALVEKHPAVTAVEFAGSRSRGTHHELSDWDFAVSTPDFAAVARDMPTLVAPLEPLSEQWEPMGHFPVYQVLLRGPTKVEYLFLDETQDAMPTPVPGPDTLATINTHFWDWTWWIATKAAAGRDDLVAEHLAQLHGHLLRPLGIESVPRDIDESIAAFVARRDALEREYGVSVPRAAEDEIRAWIRARAPAGSHRRTT
jgi:predicted nucleotidyltransferase